MDSKQAKRRRRAALKMVAEHVRSYFAAEKERLQADSESFLQRILEREKFPKAHA